MSAPQRKHKNSKTGQHQRLPCHRAHGVRCTLCVLMSCASVRMALVHVLACLACSCACVMRSACGVCVRVRLRARLRAGIEPRAGDCTHMLYVRVRAQLMFPSGHTQTQNISSCCSSAGARLPSPNRAHRGCCGFGAWWSRGSNPFGRACDRWASQMPLRACSDASTCLPSIAHCQSGARLETNASDPHAHMLCTTQQNTTRYNTRQHNTCKSSQPAGCPRCMHPPRTCKAQPPSSQTRICARDVCPKREGAWGMPWGGPSRLEEVHCVISGRHSEVLSSSEAQVACAILFQFRLDICHRCLFGLVLPLDWFGAETLHDFENGACAGCCGWCQIGADTPCMFRIPSGRQQSLKPKQSMCLSRERLQYRLELGSIHHSHVLRAHLATVLTAL